MYLGTENKVKCLGVCTYGWRRLCILGKENVCGSVKKIFTLTSGWQRFDFSKRSCVELAQLKSIYVEYSCDNRILKSEFLFSFRRHRPWSILVCSTFLQDGVVLEVLLRIIVALWVCFLRCDVYRDRGSDKAIIQNLAMWGYFMGWFETMSAA